MEDRWRRGEVVLVAMYNFSKRSLSRHSLSRNSLGCRDLATALR
jgi:hypothetical protein